MWVPPAVERYEIRALCFKGEPAPEMRERLQLRDADRR